jgi:hypothetical protein
MHEWVVGNVRIAKRDEVSRKLILRWLQLVFLFTAMIGVIMLFIWGIVKALAAGAAELPSWIAPVVSVAALAPPMLAVGRVLSSAWVALIRGESQREAVVPETNLGTEGARDDEAGKQEPTPAPILKNPFDPYGLTKQREWRNALGAGSSEHSNVLLDGKRLYRLVAVLFGVSLSLALVVLDVMREVTMQRVDEGRGKYLEEAVSAIRWNEVSRFNRPEVADWTGEIPSIRMRTLGRVASRAALTGRILFIVFALPFVMAMNIGAVYTRWGMLKQPVKTLKVMGQILLFLAVVIAFVGLGVEKGMKTQPFRKYTYVAPSKHIVTAAPAPVCGLKFHDWDVVSLAGVPLIAEAIPDEAFVPYDAGV